jgi:hypothetical protein
MKIRFHRSIVTLLLAFSFGNLFELDAAPTEQFKQLDTHGDGKLTAGDHTRSLRVGDLERRYPRQLSWYFMAVEAIRRG